MNKLKEEIDSYLKRLFPITRSITGEGNRLTLKILQEIIPLEVKEYPSGQEVYDWVIPNEWNINDAWIKNEKGEKVIDIKNSNLHILNYSSSIHEKMTLKNLKEHLFYIEELPNAIPYRTSYYNNNWGFCCTYEEYKKYFNDENEQYEVYIDTSLKKGSLTIGEVLVKGKSKEEYLISCYICHPSMANDSLSGVITTTFLVKELIEKQASLEYSYRILFVPETIGAIAYCANNEKEMQKIKNGLVVTTCGGPGKFSYKQSWEKNNPINKIIEYTFQENDISFIKYPFDIFGSDERQYSSQRFRINCASVTKDKYYEYPYYHTSLDNLDFVKAEYLEETINIYSKILNKMDKNLTYTNLKPNCEVMLGKYDLYPKTGGSFIPQKEQEKKEIILWLLFYCDGNKSLFDISQILGKDIDTIYNYAKILEEKNILRLNHE